MPKKSQGGPRNGYLGVRIPEKTKFGLTLLSRLRHEPVPDIVLQSIHNLFSTEHIGLLVNLPGEEFPKNLLSVVWALRESDRIANLAFTYPALLSAPEASVWDRVKADDRFWASSAKSGRTKGGVAPARKKEDLLRDVLAENWSALTESPTL